MSRTKRPIPTTGDRLRAARSAAGLSQAELARKAGVHKLTVSQVETDRRPASDLLLVKLAAALGRRPDALFPDLPIAVLAWRGPRECPHCGKPI
jgi:putative transcriptional regulator